MTTRSRSIALQGPARTAVALKNIGTEVELGFDPALAVAEAQRCLNCDVQTVFSEPACIECDACVDICPIDCISFVPNARGCAAASLSAPANSFPGDLCVRAGQNRPRHGQGRGPLPALRPLRGALSDRRLGHAEIHAPIWRKRGIHADPGRKRLRDSLCERQWFRLGQRQSAVRAFDPAHGRPDRPAQYFSLEHPGPADLVRSPRHRTRPSGRARPNRRDGRDEPADLRQGCRLDRAGRLSLL